MVAFDGQPEVAAMNGGSAVSQSTSAVRKYFPETWLWDCADSGFVVLRILFFVASFLGVIFTSQIFISALSNIGKFRKLKK